MASPAAAPSSPDPRQYVLDRYDDRIQYYWSASRYNKRSYKMTRYLTILLGALVTLISSVSSASFFPRGSVLSITFSILTPVLAATLAIIGGITQAFQWGAAWSDQAITATRLEKERDRVAVTPPGQVDALRELELLDDMVLSETQGFFQRLFGTGGPAGKSEPPVPVSPRS